MSLPQLNKSYKFFLPLVDKSDPSEFVTSPTIEAGDFQVSVDGGAYSNLDNLPVVTPAGSVQVEIMTSAIEMSGSKVSIFGRDQSGGQWSDVFIFLDLVDGTIETIVDILEGDHTENSIRALVKKKGTGDILIDKKVSGSGLSPNITVTTREQP